MIAEALARIEALEQQLTDKSLLHLHARLSIRGCLKELRGIRQPENPDSSPPGTDVAGRVLRFLQPARSLETPVEERSSSVP
jgi:hypothetical protein